VKLHQRQSGNRGDGVKLRGSAIEADLTHSVNKVKTASDELDERQFGIFTKAVDFINWRLFNERKASLYSTPR